MASAPPLRFSACGVSSLWPEEVNCEGFLRISGGEKHGFRWLKWTTFLWQCFPGFHLSSLNVIGNIRQSCRHFPRTTPGLEEFLSSHSGSVSIPNPVSYMELLIMALGVKISFLGLLRSLEVLSRYLLCLFQSLLLLNNIIRVCLCRPLGRLLSCT